MDQIVLRNVVQECIENSNLFLVDLKCSPKSEIEVVVDTIQGGVSIDDCVELSKKIESHFDREVEDFELMVTSAGLTQPFKVFQQYKKNIGKDVELVLFDGSKLTCRLDAADETHIEVSYKEKVAVEGKRCKVMVEQHRSLPMNEVKSVCCHIAFK